GALGGSSWMRWVARSAEREGAHSATNRDSRWSRSVVPRRRGWSQSLAFRAGAGLGVSAAECRGVTEGGPTAFASRLRVGSPRFSCKLIPSACRSRNRRLPGVPSPTSSDLLGEEWGHEADHLVRPLEVWPVAAIEGRDARAREAQLLASGLLLWGGGVIPAPDYQCRAVEVAEGGYEPLHRAWRGGAVAAPHRAPGAVIEVTPDAVQRALRQPACYVVHPALERAARREQPQRLADQRDSHRPGHRMPPVADEHAGGKEGGVEERPWMRGGPHQPGDSSRVVSDEMDALDFECVQKRGDE